MTNKINGEEKSGMDKNNLIFKFKTRTDLQLLTIIILIGMVFRFYQLGFERIWLDEAVSIRIAKQSIETILFSKQDTANPPLYCAILHFFIKYNDSEFIARLPSAIFGTVSIPLIYLLGRYLFSIKEGLISAFLLSISSIHINYSQETRSYALMLFLTLMTITFFYKAYTQNNKNAWVGFTLSAILLVYTHFFGFFVMIAISCFYFINEFDISKYKFKSSGKHKFVITSSIVFLLATSPIIIWVLQEFGYSSGHKTWGMAQEGFFSIILTNFSSYSSPLTILFFVLLVFGLIASFIHTKKPLSLLAVWLFLPLTTGYFLAGTMPFQPRYLLFTLPAFLILISRGITGITNFILPIESENIKKKSKEYAKKVKHKNQMSINIIVLIIVIITLLSYGPLHTNYTTLQKNDWETASRYLESITRPGDAVVPMPGYMRQPLEYYYDNSSDQTILTYLPYSESGLSSYVENNRAWFIVTWDISASNPDGTVLRWLQNNATFVNQISGIYIFTAPKV